ncbi:MAG: bifunctional UDP-sugar hydrolase/5'-nucleotidase [Thermoanaerobaculia bacterium]
MKNSSSPGRRASSLGIVAAAFLTGVTWPAPAAASPRRTHVTILQTTDLHGHLLAWDYARGREDDIGLARIATRVSAIRKETPNVLLLDSGDLIQGTPIEFLHARGRDAGADPMVTAMSLMKYDAMAVGNHEYNFGLDVLRKAQRESAFPWLSANTRFVKDGSAAFPEWIVKTVGGVRVGILGLTTPNVPNWEPEANRPGLRWEDPVETARRVVPLLRERERCDFVVVLIHSGPEVDLKTLEPDGTENENRVAAIAAGAPGIDLILTGHTHRRIPLTPLSKVPFIQPGRWGDLLTRVDVTFEARKEGGWTVTDLKGELLPSDASIASDPMIVKLAAPHDLAARAYLDERIAVAEDAFPADRARLEDTALLDLINEAQLSATGADLSMTSLLPGGKYEGIAKGQVTVRDIYALYPYENQLVAVEIDGTILKACLEHAAEFYGATSWAEGRLVLSMKEGMIPYNYDVIEGASYRIDPTEPVGSRVKELAFKGLPVAPGDRFTLAVNAYRAQGAGGYVALKGARVVKIVPDEIRELLIARIRERGHLVPVVNRNWRVGPDASWAATRK